ncbi:MFS transporter [Deinococcus sp.]|uniref:MFS transporter n=1 Tax=Deinococcus sp. TaxID=47478 RepID=UPI0025E18C31|nr:MFS transporter [Deinococcus sp.]
MTSSLAPNGAQPLAPPSPWTLSAFWFGTSFMWLVVLLILMPANILTFVGEASKGTYLGLAGGIIAVVGLVLPPIVGSYSDRIGKRLPLMRLGLGVNLAGLAVMALAATALSGMGGYWVYVLGLLLVQFGNNYATAPYSALVPELVPVGQRGRYSGVMGMLQGLGQLLGGVAALVVGLLKLPGLVSFVLIAVILTTSAVVTLRGVPETTIRPVVTENRHYGLDLAQLRQLFAHQPFLWVFITRALFALGQYSVQPFLNYYTKDVLAQKDPGLATSILLLTIILASVCTTLIGGRVSDRIGRKPVIYVAGSLMAVMALALLIAPSFYAALGVAFFFGLGFGAFTSVDWALGSDAMPSQRNYARDMGIWHVAFVGPQLFETPQGALLDWGNRQGGNLGYTLVFGVAALCFILGVILVRNVPETVGGKRVQAAT